MQTQNKRLASILAAVPILLLIPLVAMQFTNEVAWTLSDFIVMAILLLGTGLLCELVLRKVKTIYNRLFVCGAILVAFLVIWAELAVGLIGTPLAGN